MKPPIESFGGRLRKLGINKAEQIAGKMKVGAFELDSVNILFSIPPGIGMKFKPKK